MPPPLPVAGRANRSVLHGGPVRRAENAFAEETVLWPVFRRVLPDGDALTLLVEKEHQEVSELVTALERDGRDHPQRAGRLARLAGLVERIPASRTGESPPTSR